MHMLRRYRRSGWDLVASALLLVCVAIAGSILLLEANGYLIDFARLRIEPSGLLVVRSNPRDASLELDGLPLASRLDTTWQITPGRHELIARADDRHPWRQAFHVAPRRVAAYEHIILYWITPRVTTTREATPEELAVPLIDPILSVRAGEIWIRTGDNAELITRFSRTPLAAWMLDEHHVIVQLDAELHILERAGSNDIALLSLTDASPRQLVVRANGRELGVVSSGEITYYELY